MKVMINADDFGLTRGVTEGIIEAHENGIVDSTTLMMNGCDVSYAVDCAKKYTTLSVGIHLVLTWGKPVLKSGIDTLTDDSGYFRYTNNYLTQNAPDKKEVYREWKAQIDAFLATGLTLHHIDSHHHVHGWSPIIDVTRQLSKEYNVPVRYHENLSRYPEILLTDTLYTDFYGETIYKNIFDSIHDLAADSVEVMTHPGFVDDDLRVQSSYLDYREKEIKLLKRIKRPDWAEGLCDS